MQNPEVFLSSFNKSLKQLLKSSLMLGDREIEDKIKKLYRKTIISEIFFNKYIIAISGLQGAGKTTLIKELYDIPDNIIDPNLGRGEKIPILITEGNRTDYEFSKKIISIKGENLFIEDKTIDQDEFHLKTKDPSSTDIFLEIKVPYKIFNESEKSFVLLPGIEDNDEEYQAILRHSLISSATCLFLFDEVRYADYRNYNAVNKIKDIFNVAKPIYVLTRADQSKDNNKQLYENFKKDFNIKDDDRIIITGVGKNYKKEWYPQLLNSLAQYRQIERDFRTRQRENINNLLVDDFGVIINYLKGQLNLIKIEDSVHYREINNYMQKLSDKVDSLRKEFLKKLKENLRGQAGTARGKMDAYFANRDFWDGIYDFFRKDATKRKELTDQVKDAWEKSSGTDISLKPILKTVTQIQRKAGLLLPDNDSTAGTDLLRLGVYNESYIHIDEDLLNDFKILLMIGNPELLNMQFSQKFEHNYKLIPVLLLETLRIAILFPDLYLVNVEDSSVKMKRAANEVYEDFSDLEKKHSNIIRGIALVLGIDVAYDGKIDSIPNLITALTGAEAGSLTMTLATTAGAVLGGLFIYKSLLNQIDKSDLQNLIAANSVIAQLEEGHLLFYLNNFDDLMDTMYNQIEKSFQNRYHTTKAFRDKESLTKALADAKRIRDDFREALL